MPNIVSVATWKSTSNTIAISAAFDDGQVFTYDHVNIKKNTTAAKLESAAILWATRHNITLPEFHIHINDDRSLAIAIGPAPAVWPEDQEVEP